MVEYQLQIDPATGGCVGLEALVRWHHPTLGRLEPDAFIPLAERTGQIVELGGNILRTACQQAASLAALPDYAGLCIAVNISTRQLLEPDFTATVALALAEAGLPRRPAHPRTHRI